MSTIQKIGPLIKRDLPDWLSGIEETEAFKFCPRFLENGPTLYSF
ncbi:hypothetical protein CEV34_3886 [Brucella pseudogrignonensis]|uniref:Uncharacterized protein n=1 Tax=Brucella pseudogrignonensis TaxID=419475 RepID=A0A256G911_9HYPH|nr:hypothetical protein CEV34_3886 [Brucella pseudogrignonensis]